MSNLQKSLFSSMDRSGLPQKVLMLYKCLGVIGAVILVTSYFSDHQLLHLIGSSVCIYGMIWLCAGYEIKTKGFRTYAMYLARDISLSAVWTILMVIWLIDVL